MREYIDRMDAIKTVAQLYRYESDRMTALQELPTIEVGWIPVSERLPEEHDSIFAKYKGTDKWQIGMFEKCSDDVNVTVEYEDGTKKTKTLHTVDGCWKVDFAVKFKVIAWQPLSEPWKGEIDEKK